MSFEFMKPDIWDGLVLGSILIGLSLAVLRLMQDWSIFKRDEAQRQQEPESRRNSNPTHSEDDGN